jgi:hypothetical protein
VKPPESSRSKPSSVARPACLRCWRSARPPLGSAPDPRGAPASGPSCRSRLRRPLLPRGEGLRSSLSWLVGLPRFVSLAPGRRRHGDVQHVAGPELDPAGEHLMPRGHGLPAVPAVLRPERLSPGVGQGDEECRVGGSLLQARSWWCGSFSLSHRRSYSCVCGQAGGGTAIPLPAAPETPGQQDNISAIMSCKRGRSAWLRFGNQLVNSGRISSSAVVALVLHLAAEVTWHAHLRGSLQAEASINLSPTGVPKDEKARHKDADKRHSKGACERPKRHDQAHGSGDPVKG